MWSDLFERTMDSSDDCRVRLVNPCESSRPWYGGKPDWKTADEDESNRRSADPLDQTVLATNTQRWPSFIWFLLKLIGLYNFRPAVAKRRLCVRCHHAATERRCVVRGEGVPRYLCFGATEVTEREDELFQFMVNDEADQGEGVIRFNLPAEEPCPVCRCEWWDAHGNYRPYTDAEIGRCLKLFISRCSTNFGCQLSKIVIIITLACLLKVFTEITKLFNLSVV